MNLGLQKKYKMKKEKLIIELRNEVSLLESWISTTKYGGWSTQLIESMEKRVAELKKLLYDISNERHPWTPS